jgi:sugar phosphate isomerase/epimerase
MERREFVRLSAASALALAAPAWTRPGSSLAREPIQRSGPPRFQLGLAAYSLRDYFSYSRGKSTTPAGDGPAIDMIGFLDYCVAQGFDAAELTSYFFKPDADDDYFLELRRQAFLRGLTISGTAIGNDFTIGKGPQLDAQVEEAIAWIDRAALLGAPHIRFFAGTAQQLEANPARLQEACEALHRCAEYAAKKGIFLGVENHGQLTAEQMLEIMQRVEHPWVGINLDTGNFISDDPYGDLERCVGYAVNVQVKATMNSPGGKSYPADMGKIAAILKAANYQGFVILEFEEQKPYERIPETFAALRQALSA